MAYNTAVSTLMILVNAYDEKETITRGDYKLLLYLLNPIAPHVTEELNEELGYSPICENSWPTYDEEKTIDKEKEIAIQVNGKVRDTLKVRILRQKRTVLRANCMIKSRKLHTLKKWQEEK